MPPLSLTDDELAIILTCAAPIAAQNRAKFLEDVAAKLSEFRELGPGSVSRTVREVQARYFDPPTLGSNATGKHGR